VSIDWLKLDPHLVCLSVQVFDSGSTDDHPISTVTFQPALLLDRAANQPNGRLSKTDTGAHDPFAPPTSPRPRRAPGVRPHPHDLLQDQPVATGMFDERAGHNAAPKLSGGLSLGPLSSRRIQVQVSVCGPSRKTHLIAVYLL
jgi:hypothetical protein